MKFDGLRKPPALRLMLMILLLMPSATPLVIGCLAKRSTPSRWRLSMDAVRFNGSSREWTAQAYHREEKRVTAAPCR